MPHMSKETVTPIELGPGIEWRGDLDGYVTSIVKVTGDTDLTPLLQGLPDDRCPSPHWGYVFAGRMWFRSGDRTESFGPGEVYYVNPGHTAGADAGTEFVIFSPAEIMAEVEAHMARRAQELQDAPR